MSHNPSTTPPALYVLSSQEQQFVSRYLEPRFETFNTNVNNVINTRNDTASAAIEALLQTSVIQAKAEVLTTLRNEWVQAKNEILTTLRNEWKDKLSLDTIEAKINSCLDDGQSMHRAISSQPAVQIPRDPNAMDVDINSADSRRLFPPLPNGLTFGSFVKFCHARSMCHRCLKPYDSTHKGPDGKGIPCPNPPPKTTQEIEVFMQQNQTKAQSSVAAVSSSPHRVSQPRPARQLHQQPYHFNCLQILIKSP
ncbi:uncharacterized protein MELLADRAFT_114140 [Melampsora larici-populina 98AG31]|uniref:Uncharacterized protein n=1 Tax=Melampsora larici-populina (strain 98AG31 / pathotype 3-4-7) TaxID=747676 RepID=F4SCB3_MELLP|nr:uncharacterized protein MELLADRAFT_114140 [Melampsora larici-populina 98AG31]EGF97717.1 hypothetical protein MELLADRAFT_114140 [Melampsora larici-populina 98AG31]